MKHSPNHPVRKIYTSELSIAPEHIDAFIPSWRRRMTAGHPHIGSIG